MATTVIPVPQSSVTLPVITPQQEHEDNALPDNQEQITQQITFMPNDMTLNIMSTTPQHVLMAMIDGDTQHLLAGARANVGIVNGRYVFEVKILAINPSGYPDSHDQQEQHLSQSRYTKPLPILKIGFASTDSSLFLDDCESSICFEYEVSLTHKTISSAPSATIIPEQVISVLLNLSTGHTNAFTISFFRDGVPLEQPRPLPDALKGKALFPTVTFRALTVHVNFGSTPIAKLPFVCPMIQNAASKDVVIARDVRPSDGKHKILSPVCWPSEGTSEWLDIFLTKSPEYTELSDRMLLDWIERSGILTRKDNRGAFETINYYFGAHKLNNLDAGLRRILTQIAPLQQRNYIVMDFKGNLLENARAETLKRFDVTYYKHIAMILVGEPSHSIDDHTDTTLLNETKRLTNEEYKVWLLKKQQQREIEYDTMNTRFQKPSVFDQNPHVRSANFTNFTLPTTAEGFNTLVYMWQNKEQSIKCVEQWMNARKIPTRIENIAPSEWFRQEWAKWQTQLFQWHQTLNEFKNPAPKISTTAKMVAPCVPEGTSALATAAASLEETTATAVTEMVTSVDEQPMCTEEKHKEDFDVEITYSEDINVFNVTNVCNIDGKGEPLFGNFSFEDWALLSLRVELHLLVHAFRRDVNAPEQNGIHQEHLPFYYHKYINKCFKHEFYGVGSCEDMVHFIRDTIYIDPDLKIFQSTITADLDSFDIFVKLTEESRRERQLRLDAGEKLAPLKFNKALPTSLPLPPPAPQITHDNDGKWYSSQQDRHSDGPYSLKSSNHGGSASWQGGYERTGYHDHYFQDTLPSFTQGQASSWSPSTSGFQNSSSRKW
ncbi:MAG: hypothetical protein NZ807_08315 [Dehalococcoidia bacterium]|nr:hypothetical protein [Dehalococcoidia bacterium]